MPQGKDAPINYTDSFHQALSLQQNNKADEALNIYLKLLDKSPSDLSSEQASVVSYNAAVIYYQQQKYELGYVFSEKAIALNESNSSAKTLKNEIIKNFKPNNTSKEASVLEQAQNVGLKYVPIEFLGFFSFVFLFICFRQLFNFIIQKKKSDIENTAPPALSIKTYIIASLLIVSTILLSLKFLYSRETRGILKATAMVQAAPGENQAAIIEAPIASTMNILQTRVVDSVEYVQIKVPGSYSGWIKKQDIELLNSLRWP